MEVVSPELLPYDLGLPPKFQRYRKGQLETSLAIASNGKRVALLQASTGSGKSLLVQTISKLYNMRTLTITPSKALQRQYTKDFSYLALVEGSDNYRCADSFRMGRRTCAADEDGSANCRYRRRVRDGLPVEAKCPYLQAQQAARDSDNVISNTAYWLALGRHNPAALGTFGLLVADEAHNLLGALTDACAMTFTTSELRAINVDTPPVGVDAWHAWALEAIDAAVAAYRSARDKGASPQTLATLTELGKRLRELSNAASGIGDVTWVGEPVRGGWRWVPVWPAKYVESKLWRGIERVVLSSATLTHEDAKHLGLRRDDYSLHELDAGFDARRHPLYFQPVARVDKDMSDGDWRLCMNAWDRFARPRLQRGWRGVVQATSYDYAERFVADFKYSDQCALHGRHNSRDVVAAFARGEGPPVLVSPAVKEGHDFDGDKCRWQIILKVPSPNTLSPVVRARCQSDKMFRYHLTGRDLEQRCGRNMRSHSDFGECLIVDEHFIYMRAKPVFTAAFRRTWRVVDRTPEPLEV